MSKEAVYVVMAISLAWAQPSWADPERTRPEAGLEAGGEYSSGAGGLLTMRGRALLPNWPKRGGMDLVVTGNVGFDNLGDRPLGGVPRVGGTVSLEGTAFEDDDMDPSRIRGGLELNVDRDLAIQREHEVRAAAYLAETWRSASDRAERQTGFRVSLEAGEESVTGLDLQVIAQGRIRAAREYCHRLGDSADADRLCASATAEAFGGYERGGLAASASAQYRFAVTDRGLSKPQSYGYVSAEVSGEGVAHIDDGARAVGAAGFNAGVKF